MAFQNSFNHSFIHSFIHIEHLYSSSSRKLLRSAFLSPKIIKFRVNSFLSVDCFASWIGLCDLRNPPFVLQAKLICTVISKVSFVLVSNVCKVSIVVISNVQLGFDVLSVEGIRLLSWPTQLLSRP